MNRLDYQKFKLVDNMLKDLGLSTYISGEKFMLNIDNKLLLGTFNTVDDLFNYVCGYHQGRRHTELLEL